MVLAALVYACGNVTYVLLHKFIKLDTKIISLGLTSVTFILVSVLNFVENAYLAMLPLFLPLLFNGTLTQAMRDTAVQQFFRPII